MLASTTAGFLPNLSRIQSAASAPAIALVEPVDQAQGEEVLAAVGLARRQPQAGDRVAR